MIYAHIVDTTQTNIWPQRAKKAIVMVNAALTGTIQVIDGTTGTVGNVGIITNPTVGSKFEYWGFNTGVRVISSATCDITVSVDNSNG